MAKEIDYVELLKLAHEKLGSQSDMIAELEKAMAYLVAVDLKRDAIVMANARRLIKSNARTSNGRLYSELFGCGCGSGRIACRELGLSPDCNKTSYQEMCNHINLKLPKEQE
jgi:hypothetical protein